MLRLDVHRLADESTFNRFHARVLLWGMLILVLDGYDLAVVGAALPSIMKEMGVDAAQAGLMASSALVGMMLGAMGLGTLADRIGRPLTIAICVVLFSVFTAAAGLTSEPVGFCITRFLAGLGIGGVLPVVTAQMAEFAPARLRARLITLVFTGYSVGGILVALVGKQLIDAHGWPSVFFAAGLPVLLVPLILKTMPESLAFLVRRQRHAELRQILARLAPGASLPAQVEFVLPPADRASGTTVGRLFRDGRARSTVMLWVAFFTGLFMTYALSSWLAKLMAMAGYSLGSALNFVIVFNLGAIVGAVAGGWLGDRFHLQRVLVAFYALGALSLALMGQVQSTALLFATVFVVGASTLGTQLLAYAYAGAFYPAAIRSTGVGFASGVGRTGAIAAPILIGVLVAQQLPLAQNFVAIACAGLLGTVAALLIDHRRAATGRVAPAAAAPAERLRPAVART